MKTTLRHCMALVLCMATGICLIFPNLALADNYRWAENTVVDKADFYEEGEHALLPQATSVTPLDLSLEMLYFCEYESGLNYDEGLGPGDDYHAMGAFQIDNRYGLGEFISACYHYNPQRYHMFAQFEGRDLSVDLHVEDGFTELGYSLNEAWHAAYAANPVEFSQLQNGYAYDNYYLQARSFLMSKGVNIDVRADCVKGLCWGMCNLFGPSGWQWFFNGSGASESLGDREFAATLANYVSQHVAERYPNQSQYWNGWSRRYRNELIDCLGFLDSRIVVAHNVLAMHRLYNHNSGEHFYTASTDERNGLILAGWSYETIGWFAPSGSNTPVYRLYNPMDGDHHYTIDANERGALVALGWKDEGIGWYSDDGKTYPLYRQYNPNAKTGTHNYTASKAENDFLIANGWHEEGIGWYAV